jgi:hypothetical protein
MKKAKRNAGVYRTMRGLTDQKIGNAITQLINAVNGLHTRTNKLAENLGWCLEKLEHPEYMEFMRKQQAQAEAAARGEQVTDGGLVLPASAGKVVLTDGK